jgi:hypothetical protein
VFALYRLFTFTLLLIGTPSFGQTDCILRKDDFGIKVYSCTTENSKFKLIKAEFTVTASANQLTAMWLDPENYTKWQYNTVEANLIKRLNNNEIIYYTEVAAPWPVSNRDLVVHLKVSEDKQTKTLHVSAKSVSDIVPLKEQKIRIPSSISSWKVTPINESQFAVEYSMEIDPGGYVPAWMVNMVAAEAPYESFRNFKKIVEKP